MAEFCLECWNRLHETNHSKFRYIMSDEGDINLCEGCGEWGKPVVVMARSAYYYWRFRFIIFPFEIIFRILRIPYVLWQFHKIKRNKAKFSSK